MGSYSFFPGVADFRNSCDPMRKWFSNQIVCQGDSWKFPKKCLYDIL